MLCSKLTQIFVGFRYHWPTRFLDFEGKSAHSPDDFDGESNFEEELGVVLGTHTPRSRMQVLQPLPLVRCVARVQDIGVVVSIFFRPSNSLLSPDIAPTKCILFYFFMQYTHPR
jgi:hypothetical protein